MALIQDFLSKEEIKFFTTPSNVRGLQAVVTTWVMIATCFAAAILWPTWWVYLLALIILGGRHLALAILMHDCSHDSLFASKKLNNFFGRWFCSFPTWQDLGRYRDHHWNHHRKAGTKEDPDISLVEIFPVSRASLFRKFLRDITGVSGLRRVYGLLLMDLGYIKYTVANDVVSLDQSSMTLWKRLKLAATNLHGVIITNVILFLVLASVGHPGVYALWIISYLTTFSLFLRIRSIAEHAGTQMNPDPRLHTRTTHANVLARLTVAPIRVNYHLEHHIAMTVPYFLLPQLHKILKERGMLSNAILAPDYLSVLKQNTVNS